VHAIVADYTSENGAIYLDRRFYLERWGDPGVDSLSVYLAPGADADSVADGIHRALGGGTTLFVTRFETLRKQLLSSLTQMFSYSRSVELVTLLIALMGVTGTMIAAVLDRTREIAMLRAVGATSRQVATALVVEAAFLGVCAIVIGVVLGVVLCLLFLKTVLIMGTGWKLDFAFPWGSFLRISSLSIGTSVLAGGIPAWRAARTDVAGSVVYE
jgi:putative ABC transport system permease protein